MRIFIDNEYSKKTIEMRKQLIPIFKIQRRLKIESQLRNNYLLQSARERERSSDHIDIEKEDSEVVEFTQKIKAEITAKVRR